MHLSTISKRAKVINMKHGFRGINHLPKNCKDGHQFRNITSILQADFKTRFEACNNCAAVRVVQVVKNWVDCESAKVAHVTTIEGPELDI